MRKYSTKDAFAFIAEISSQVWEVNVYFIKGVNIPQKMFLPFFFEISSVSVTGNCFFPFNTKGFFKKYPIDSNN